MTDRATAPESAKLLKAHLRRVFPGVAFSVRLSRGTGYGYCDISWTDGPTEPAVMDVARPYQGTTFNGMIDLEEYVAGANLPDGRRTGLRGIACTRHLSAALLRDLVAQVGVDYHVPRENWPTVIESEFGAHLDGTADRTSPIVNGSPYHHSWQALVWRASRGDDR